jgi:hypothetical protein
MVPNPTLLSVKYAETSVYVSATTDGSKFAEMDSNRAPVACV